MLDRNVNSYSNVTKISPVNHTSATKFYCDDSVAKPDIAMGQLIWTAEPVYGQLSKAPQTLFRISLNSGSGAQQKSCPEVLVVLKLYGYDCWHSENNARVFISNLSFIMTIIIKNHIRSFRLKCL